MNSTFGVSPLRNQPDQEQWLALPLEEQAYWLLKIIDHYRDTRSMVAKPRENEGYQTGTMLIKPDGFNHHEDQAISVVDQSTRWLLNNGYMRQYPGQADGIFQITEKGFDLIDIVKRDNDSVCSLTEFIERKRQLDSYEVEPSDVLGLFVSKMEKTGKSHNQVILNIRNIHAINLSRANNINIQLPSLLSAARICKSRNWLKTKYLNSGEFENLYITQEGVSEYDSRKSQEKLEVNKSAEQSSTALTTDDSSNESDGMVESDPANRNHYVIIVHGIRTQSEYQTKLANKLEENPKIKAITLGYEFFDVIRFLTIGRNGPINKITTDIRDVKTMDPSPEKISIIAHSFGTYIVSKILERNTDIDFHRIIFCGSIVPSTFRWDKYKGRFETPILNDCGMFDIWPVFAKFATWGYGPSGRFGFKSNRVRDRFHRFKHSDFFSVSFINDYWMPFIETGDVVEGELEREKTPWWISMLTLIKAPLLLLALVIFIFKVMSEGDFVESNSQADLIPESNNISIEDESIVDLNDTTAENATPIGHCVISIGGEQKTDGPEGDNECDVLRLGISQIISVGFSEWSRRFDSDTQKCVFKFEWYASRSGDCSELASKVASDTYVRDKGWLVGSQLLEDAQVEKAVRSDNRYELLVPNFISWEHEFVEIQRFDGWDNKSENLNKLKELFDLHESLPGSHFRALVVTNDFYWDGSTKKDAICEYVEDLLASNSDALITCETAVIKTQAQSGIKPILQEIVVQIAR